MVKTAIILAAGRGTRMQPLTYEIPKGFIDINGTTLIERSVNILQSKGIDRVIIGTGHLAAFYDQLATQMNMQTIHNAEYADTGSFHTLRCAANLLTEDFLLLESDLLYDAKAIESILSSRTNDVLLCSGFTSSGDEVYVSHDGDGRLINLSKNKAALPSIDAEMVGIWKLSKSTLEKTISYFENNLNAKTIDYEHAFAQMAGRIPFQTLTIPDLIWCEIDDAAHLARAKDQILPKLKK